MNTDYVTMIVFLPTSNRSETYEELRDSVRSLLGSVYENKDAKKAIDNDSPMIPINYMKYDRQLDSEEKEAIRTMCNNNGIVVLYIEGTESVFINFGKAGDGTIIIQGNE